jgi:hypothetical protein
MPSIVLAVIGSSLGVWLSRLGLRLGWCGRVSMSDDRFAVFLFGAVLAVLLASVAVRFLADVWSGVGL